MRGRKPKPAALRRLEGNRSRRPIREAIAAKPEIPLPPWPLTKSVKREWLRLAPLMHEHQLLCRLDGHAVTALAQVIANFRRAQRALDRYGPVIPGTRGTLVANPAVGLLKDSLGAMLRLFEQFGLTPSARMRVAPQSAGKPEPENEFEQFIREKK